MAPKPKASKTVIKESKEGREGERSMEERSMGEREGGEKKEMGWGVKE